MKNNIHEVKGDLSRMVFSQAPWFNVHAHPGERHLKKLVSDGEQSRYQEITTREMHDITFAAYDAANRTGNGVFADFEIAPGIVGRVTKRDSSFRGAGWEFEHDGQKQTGNAYVDGDSFVLSAHHEKGAVKTGSTVVAPVYEAFNFVASTPYSTTIEIKNSSFDEWVRLLGGQEGMGLVDLAMDLSRRILSGIVSHRDAAKGLRRLTNTLGFQSPLRYEVGLQYKEGTVRVSGSGEDLQVHAPRVIRGGDFKALLRESFRIYSSTFDIQFRLLDRERYVARVNLGSYYNIIGTIGFHPLPDDLFGLRPAVDLVYEV